MIAKKALIGLAVVGAGAAVALSNAGEAKAASKPSSDKDKKPDKDKKTPSGKSALHISDQTFDALRKQEIARIRELVKDWEQAGDPLTAGALSFTLEAAVRGEQQPEWPGDGSKGSPLLRAFGDRVLILEGRPKKLNMWADDYKPVMPVLAAALKAKAEGIDPPSPEKGSTDDAVPDAKLLQQIIATMASGDPIAMRKLADELDRLGFDSQADDLRKAAQMIEDGSAKVPEPEKPAPAPVLPGVPTPPAPAPTPVIPKPPGGAGRVVIVKKGEGPFQVTQRLLGKNQGARFKELVKLNIPPKKSDGKGGFTSLNPGERLKVPSSWPEHKDAIQDDGSAVVPGTSLPAPPAPAQALQRFVVVKKGEGPFQIAQRVLGASQGAARWRELVTANIPPKKSNGQGGFTSLNAGERLKVPDAWPASQEIVFGADLIAGNASPMNPRQAAAGRIALMIYLRKIPPQVLANWQRSEGVEPDGAYGPATAYCLCFRFGLVPPLPHTWGKKEAENRRKFASQMMAAARRDPQRADEFMRVARQASGGAQPS